MIRYLGLFLTALLFLGFYGKKTATCKNPLFSYGLTMTVLVLCPITAWGLLKYQTAFYTYHHLFLLLPITPVIAWAMTEGAVSALEYLGRDTERGAFVRKQKGFAEGIALAVCAVLLMLSGTVALAAENTHRAENTMKIPTEVLEVLQTLENTENVDMTQELLTAPDEVLEYARAYSGRFHLLYGRNMWISELNAYTYDTYPAFMTELHAWLNPAPGWISETEAKVVENNMSPAEAAEKLAESGCTMLVLRTEQYENAAVREALEQGNCFVYLTDTEKYVILQKKR